MRAQPTAPAAPPQTTVPRATVKAGSLGSRLKAWRETKGLRQADASSLFGVPYSSYQKYEMNLSLPGADAIERFVRAGVDANWLLTGEGPMTAPAVEPTAPCAKRLQAALETVETSLSRAGHPTVSAEKKAALVLRVYDLLQEPAASKEKVLKLLELVL
ncbi:hypothetical protein C8261_09935 [Pseudothauera lacus]|uniref:HTH cro/C1-type domain-containing protein n=2 Tax=Pseudothauera lacus TaxID=2136175 RepID=A0A2T4IEN3_9RHOO|nr:hypothetical protein C8261_09935 [Pseudothauera lacus]